MATIVRRSTTVRQPRRAVQPVIPNTISLQKTFDQCIGIMTQTKSPEMCLLIGDDTSSVFLYRYKNTVQIVCDIPGVLMMIDITKISNTYKCTVKTGEGWAQFKEVDTFKDEVDLSDSKMDSYDQENMKMLINLVDETFNSLQGGN